MVDTVRQLSLDILQFKMMVCSVYLMCVSVCSFTTPALVIVPPELFTLFSNTRSRLVHKKHFYSLGSSVQQNKGQR